MIRQYLNVTVTGSPSDVHVRIGAPVVATGPATYRQSVAFCGVYVRPVGPVPGYWYFPEGDAARTLLASLPVQS